MTTAAVDEPTKQDVKVGQVIELKQRILTGIPDEYRAQVRDRMRTQAGQRIVSLLEDGRDYHIHLEWQEERAYLSEDRFTPITGYTEVSLYVLCLLRDFGDAEIGEVVMPQSYDTSLLIVPKLLENDTIEQREFERIRIGGLRAPDAPRYYWKRTK